MKWMNPLQSELYCARYDIRILEGEISCKKTHTWPKNNAGPTCSCGTVVTRIWCELPEGHAGPCAFWCMYHLCTWELL
jgi:hypothetical protein